MPSNQSKPQTDQSGILSDAEFVALVTSGGELPKKMSAAQRRYLKENAPEKAEEQTQSPEPKEEPKEPEGGDPEATDEEEEFVRPDETIVLGDTGTQEEPDEEEGSQSRYGKVEPGDNGAPPVSFSSHRPPPRPEYDVPWLKAHRSPNENGLYVTEDDDCGHTSLDKGGSCTIQGFKACPFLGGNQTSCEIYEHIETTRAKMKARRP